VFIRSCTFGAVVLSLVGCGGKGAPPDDLPAGRAGNAPDSGSASNENGGTAAASGGAVGAGGAPASGGAITAAGGAGPGAGGAIAAGGAASNGPPADVSFVMDSFSVPPGGEYYKCQDFPNTFGKDIAILESHSSMTVGSHHLFVFRLTPDGFYGAPSNLGPNNTKGPLVDCPSGGTEFHPYVHAAQAPEQDSKYPDGVGQAFNSNETARIMVHYLNTKTEPVKTSVTVTMRYVAADQVQQLAASIFLNTIGIRVPAGKTTQTFSYKLTSDINLLAASGHMHQRGIHFVATAIKADGTKKELYTTDTWDEPTPGVFDPATPLANGSGIQWACSYDNQTGKTLRFGESAVSNEMCIFTGTYYPAPGGGGIYSQDFGAGTSTAN
jgi:hypothetical protein